MCLQTTPPIVVIAMCTGKIYHAILLREISDDNDDDDRKVWRIINIEKFYVFHVSRDITRNFFSVLPVSSVEDGKTYLQE